MPSVPLTPTTDDPPGLQRAAVVAVASPPVGDARRDRPQRLVRLASGLLVTFVAFGCGAWLSGAASWVAFYAGARGQTLTTIAQVAAAAGFGLGIALALAWYARRCRRGVVDIAPRAALVACLVLPAGAITWAIFVDAVAYRYGDDIVRPAFDDAIMYLVLGGLPLLVVGVPWVMSRLRLRGQRDEIGRSRTYESAAGHGASDDS